MERYLEDKIEWKEIIRKRLYKIIKAKSGTIRILIDPDTKISNNHIDEYTPKMSNTKISKIKRRIQALILSINF